MLRYVYDLKTAGDKMRLCRERMGLSIQEVANRLGKGLNTVADWENGKKSIQPAQMADLATLYQVSLEDLFFLLRNEYSDDVAYKAEFEIGEDDE